MCILISSIMFFFFFQAEDGIRDDLVTGVQTCALPIWFRSHQGSAVDRTLVRAEPTGFEPAIFCVTGRHVRPLHHGSWLVHLLGASSRMIPDSRSLVKCLECALRFLHQSLAGTEFCIQDLAACRPAYRVVAEQDEFVA